MIGKSCKDGRVPLVSVAIPSYNHGRYVQEALKSVLLQDWPRMEIVLVDDGSPDDTFEKACEMKGLFEGRFERVVFEKKRNEGTCATFNRLRELYSGDFLILLASDDALLPGAVGALLAPMLADESVGVAAGVNELMDGDGRRCYWDKDQNVVHEVQKAAYLTFNDQIASYAGVNIGSPKFGDYRELARCNHVPNGCLFRRAALDMIPPFTPDAPLEDYWMHLQLAKVTRYASVPEHTFRYRWHGANTASQHDKMVSMERKTLRWEEAFVFSRAGAAWRRPFCEARGRKVVKPIIGRAVYRELLTCMDVCVKTFHVLGMKFVYRVKFLKPAPQVGAGAKGGLV